MAIVNFVREYRRFIRYASDNKLTASERLLWYALMEIMNEEADGNDWPDGFIRVSNGRVLMYCNPMGIDTMMRARNGLKQRGLIDFQAGSKNRENPAYKMHYLCAESYTQNAYNDDEGYTQNTNNEKSNTQNTNNGYTQNTDKKDGNPQNAYKNDERNTQNTDKSGFYTQNTSNMGYNMRYNVGDNMGDNMGYILYKHKPKITQNDFLPDDDEEDGEEEHNDERARASIARGFADAFGYEPYPAEVNRLWINGKAMGFSPEMIVLAAEEAALHHAEDPVAYIWHVLDGWNLQHVKQPHQIDQAKKAYGIRKQSGPYAEMGTGDPFEDLRRQEEEKEQRIAENREAGIG